jgi:hypothetical protein
MQPSSSWELWWIARRGGARRIRLLAAAATVLQLIACGGSEAPAAPNSEPNSSHAQPMARSQAQTPAVPVVATAAHGCVRQVTQSLKANAPEVNADCLAGTYLGVDERGKDCALVIAASNGRFRFVERDKTLSVEAELTAAAAVPAAQSHAYSIERADVEMGQIGLLLGRRSAASPGVVETLELAAGETRNGSLGLASASYMRVQGGGSTIARCYFDT